MNFAIATTSNTVATVVTWSAPSYNFRGKHGRQVVVIGELGAEWVFPPDAPDMSVPAWVRPKPSAPHVRA